MEELLILLLGMFIVGWLIIQAASILALICGINEMVEAFDTAYGSPKYIYDNSDLNWFGVIVSFLGLFLLFPVYYLLMGLYWLFHIGRKE